LSATLRRSFSRRRPRRVDKPQAGHIDGAMFARALTLAFVCTFPAFGAAPVTEPLSHVATFHLRQARFATAALTDGQAIYVVGGTDHHELIGTVERLDPLTGATTLISDKLIPRNFGSAALVAGKIYTFGGWTHGTTLGDPDARVEQLDLATGKVTLMHAMPKPRTHMAAVVRQGRIYLIGGNLVSRGALVQSGMMEIYEPATDRWSDGPPMPTPREAHAALVGDFIVAPAGYAANAAVAKVEMFVPAETQWKALPDLRQRVSACAVGFLGEDLFLFGDYGSLGQVLAYNLRDRSSRAIKPGFDGVRHAAAVVVGRRIYIIGGTRDQDNVAVDLVQVFELRDRSTTTKSGS
jgi:hypothetical protein